MADRSVCTHPCSPRDIGQLSLERVRTVSGSRARSVSRSVTFRLAVSGHKFDPNLIP
jgi:hypothetical protein